MGEKDRATAIGTGESCQLCGCELVLIGDDALDLRIECACECVGVLA